MKERINLKAPQHLISVSIFLKLIRLEEICTFWMIRLEFDFSQYGQTEQATFSVKPVLYLRGELGHR